MWRNFGWINGLSMTIFLATFVASACVRGGEMKKIKAQRDWSDAIIYFVIVDRFADGNTGSNRNVDLKGKGTFHGGDLAGLTQQLDEIADLGATAIWITPVVKNIDHYVSEVGFPDWAYHGYWADDFYQIDDRFGSEADLKNLVDEAHARGIKVLLDVVYNHAGYQSAYTKKPNANEWMRTGRRESLCGDDDLTSCLAGLPDFKTEKQEVADYLMGAHLGLAKRVGLDGFRLDTVKHVDHPFWQDHRDRVNTELGDDFFLLGEVWGGSETVLDPWFVNDEMNAGFDFGFKGSVQGFVQGRGRTIAFSRYLMKRHRVRKGYYLSHYLSSHDVPGALWELKGNRDLFKLTVALQMTTLGIPCIFYGEEVGRIGGDWPDNRSDMPWGDRDIKPGAGKPRDESMRDYYKKLIQIRRAHPALSGGSYKELSTEGDLLVFGKEKDGATVWVAVNRGREAASVVLPVPEAWKGKAVHDALSGAKAKASEAGMKLETPAQSAQIYVLVQ